jgi:hypothetical protein
LRIEEEARVAAEFAEAERIRIEKESRLAFEAAEAERIRLEEAEIERLNTLERE